MALLNRQTWRQHRPWAAAVVGTAAAIAAYVWAARSGRDWPTGSTPVLLALGVTGGLLILFEFAIVLRKRLRTWRLFGPARVWMAAHLWLGLLTVPLAVLHSGFYLGGSLATALMAVFLLVILSGVIGAVVQAVVPRLLLERVSSETVYSEIPWVVGTLRRDAERLVRELDHAFDLERLPDETAPDREEWSGGLAVVAGVRQAGRVRGKTLAAQALDARSADVDRLTAFVRGHVDPFLRPRPLDGSPLASARGAEAIFRGLRDSIDPALHETTRLLEDLCAQRRDLMRQARYHRWLHAWLAFHLPLSVVLVLLLIAHVAVAVLYW